MVDIFFINVNILSLRNFNILVIEVAGVFKIL